MKKLLILPALLALAACGSPAPAPAAKDADPALWVVKDDDTTIYLFGTIHALKPGLSWFDEGVKQAFDKSDSLVLELVLPPDAELQALVGEIGFTPGQPPLSAQLPAGEAMKMQAALAAAGQPRDGLDAMEPWLAAVMLANLPSQQAGYEQKDGAEAVLTAAAKAAGKPVEGLETAREQFGYFDRLSPGAQRALLVETIDGLPKGAETLDQIVARWRAGDADGIAKLINEDLADSPELAEALLVNRNRHWADWIAGRMKTPGTVFVAVGAGHLAGGQSVLAELSRRGFSVTRVTY
ncbi:TraB/GumN family protein [Sphingomonas sp. LB-2]|uniref:TraB/GumN family protein n=1 Tax=Sphingomonas caeni TaxID=2984949 RepID=UPI00222F8052|nr:TraB/GumN family protein [Sphingomonas caeni]MCW3848945.1 TraB/GumN family protein [Sphingomonas caeni]